MSGRNRTTIYLGRSTYQLHAQIARRLVNLDREESGMICTWPDCDHKSVSLYQYLYHHHDTRVPCMRAKAIAEAHGDPGHHQVFHFCSEGHRELFHWSGGWRALAMIESQGRAFGNVPTGSKSMLRH